MTELVEFGRKDAADAAREEFGEYLCPVDDDARRKTVAWVSDTPDEVMDQIRAQAEDSRVASTPSAGQMDLSDDELDRLVFDEDGVNVPKARSVKAIADQMGVDDWITAFDRKLTVDEYRDVLERFREDERGDRVERTDQEDRQASAARTQRSEQCNHAEGHCANGDQEACEFLQTACGLTENEVSDLTAPPDPAAPDAPMADEVMPDGGATAELSGKQLGALQRSWGGYQAAVEEMREQLMRLRESFVNAQQAARAINGIRSDVGQEELHFEKLEEANAGTLDTVRMMAAECHECHARHEDHDHDVDVDELEDLREFVGGGGTGTPVGVSDETQDAIEAALDVPEEVHGFEIEEVDPDNLVWENDRHRVEVYSHGGSMDHHFSTFVRHVGRDHDSDEPGVIAEFTASRPAADDMGRERNRSQAVDAAIDYMRTGSIANETERSDPTNSGQLGRGEA